MKAEAGSNQGQILRFLFVFYGFYYYEFAFKHQTFLNLYVENNKR